VAEPRRWIILSPHLDDGVLSCGGLAHALAKKHRVAIWTFFSRAPRRGPYSHTAQWLHGISGGHEGENLARIRREEDAKACAAVGAEHRHLEWMDAVYRRRADGRFLYRECRQNVLHPADSDLVREMLAFLAKEVQPSDIVVAPMAIGGHVDHVAVREAAFPSPATLLYYPEVPYVQTCAHRLESYAERLHPVKCRLDDTDARAWREGALSYESQMEMFAGMNGGLMKVIDECAASRELWIYAREAVTVNELSPLPIFEIEEAGKSARAGYTGSLFGPFVAENEHTDFPEWADSPLAPIALFTFRRLDLLKQTLAALERAEGFTDTPVHVFSDGPRPGNSEDAERIAELREWTRQWCARHGATLHESARNRGLRASITSGVSQLLEKHERVIVLEDDIVVSPAFLVYMNQALSAYSERDDVMQVSGYAVPHGQRLAPVGLLRVPSSWGWGTWRRAWQHYDNDPVSLLSRIREADVNAFELDGSYGYLDELERNVTGTIDTWAIRWYASMFLRRGLAVYPATSFTRNIGFGDDGTNCKPGPMAEVYRQQRMRRRRISPDWDAQQGENAEYARAFAKFFRWQQHQWTKPSLGDRVRAAASRMTGNREHG
jgi:LmbE family N-acetylglucosaminyl deacetylase